MKRRGDWPERLSDYLEGCEDRKFKRGAWDCALFCADAIREMTDIDPGEDYRGLYADEEGARSVCAAVSGLEGADVPELAESLAERHGMPEISPFLAGRGDVVLCDSDLGPALGVVTLDGRFAAFASRPEGLVFIRVRACRRAWKVG